MYADVEVLLLFMVSFDSLIFHWIKEAVLL